MEDIIFDQSPLAEYMKDDGEHHFEHVRTPSKSDARDESPPLSPSFAPTGRPTVKKRFRSRIPNPLRLDTLERNRLSSFPDSYAKAVASRLDRADNLKFLEQFRYTIVASQLLSGHSVNGQNRGIPRGQGTDRSRQNVVPTSTGLFVTAAAAMSLAWMSSWVYTGGWAHLIKKRVLFALVVIMEAIVVSHAYIRQQWLRYVRTQALAEVSAFVARTQDFDSVSGATLALIQEVELVSRGYRISAPLPPISRLEDRSQIRRCKRLRRTLKSQFVEMIQKYAQVSIVVQGFSEQLNLEKFYDIYDINDLDISDARQGFTETEFDDPESLRSLKIAAARFHTLRKLFLCALLALEARGNNSDFLRWSAAVEALRELSQVSQDSFDRLQTILREEESFPSPPANKGPSTPGRERWRSQLRKLNSLSSGIRGLQAKLTLLREESDRRLNEAQDISELGPNLLGQYESIGQDLKLLTQAWEEGKAALASGIDRNEKRLSTMSTVLSPASSLSGVTVVEEGGILEALKALNGESPLNSALGSPRAEQEEAEVFEAVALSRPRSMIPREERLKKMREDRDKRELAKEKAETTRGMLRELEMVIKLRPTRPQKTTATPAPARFSI